MEPNIRDEFIIKFKTKYEAMSEDFFEKNYNDEGLIYVDYSVIKKQRESVTYLVKKIGVHLLKGESVMNISLPVHMFDERSLPET